MEYAIVDIETTGGHASGCGITEIAIRIHDGQQVKDRYETLIDPGRSIPLSIQALTGITNDMLEGQPPFRQVADRIHELLSGRVFVAHNVNFDYSFVKHHLEMAGIRFQAPRLCTVRMSRLLRPGLRSYSLGNLCSDLGIPVENRHRAGGDADATAILFGMLLQWDTEGAIPSMLRKTSKDQQLPPNLPRSDFDALPEKPGVYYFRDHAGKVLYVGKAVNLRKRVASHFTGHNPHPQRQNFLRNIHAVSFEQCGTELMALLLEAIEIKRLWPSYNRALKRFEPKYALYSYEGLDGYQHLAIGRQSQGQLRSAFHVYNRFTDGTDQLHKLAAAYNLCPQLCRIGPCPAGCTAHDAPGAYNERVAQALRALQENLPSFMILDKGRREGEQSMIWVEKGHFYGMGYLDSSGDMTTPEDIKASLGRYESNAYIMQLIYGYAEKQAYKVHALP